MEKFYITSPIYYVNSKPHIGHAYTTIVADVLARYYRFKLGQENVWFLAGTDEHGAKVAQSAEKEGKDPQQFCDEISALYKSTWQNLNISNDDYIRTTEPRHIEVVKTIVEKLKEAGAIYEGEYEGLYCVGCESYKKEEDLVDGKCPDHGVAPQLLKERNWFFKLSAYSDIVKEKIISGEIKILPVEREKEVLSFIDQGLEDIAMSREQVKWGIPIPFDKHQTIYVWVDALINYVSALGYPDGDKFKTFWNEAGAVHLLGKDILKFHAIIWPAMLIAADIRPPREMVVHGYFTIDGKKMSKTLGNIIDPNDLVNEFGADATRYLVVSQFPFGQDGDLRESDNFKIKYNSDLANGIGNLVSRVFGMVEKYCDNTVPDKKYTDGLVDFSKIWREVDEFYREYKIFEVIKYIWSVISVCDNYVAENKPWELAKAGKQAELEQVLYNLLEAIRQLAYLINPILPGTSAHILAELNITADKYDNAIKSGALVGGSKINKAEPLFLRK